MEELFVNAIWVWDGVCTQVVFHNLTGRNFATPAAHQSYLRYMQTLLGVELIGQTITVRNTAGDLLLGPAVIAVGGC